MRLPFSIWASNRASNRALILAPSTSTRTVVALLVVGSGSTVAIAQNALDANLRQGSGGQNSSGASTLDAIRRQSDIVTGNATDGRAFRGDTGYGAAGDFRGDLGSNDIFTFRRDAFLSGLIGSGISTRDAISQLSSSMINSSSTGSLAGRLSLPRSGAGSLYDARQFTIERTPSLQTAFGDLTLLPSTRTGDYRGQSLSMPTENPLIPAGMGDMMPPSSTSMPDTPPTSHDVGNQIIMSFGDQLRTRSDETPTLNAAMAQFNQPISQIGTRQGAEQFGRQFGDGPRSPFTDESMYTSIIQDLRQRQATIDAGKTISWEQQLKEALTKFDNDIEQARLDRAYQPQTNQHQPTGATPSEINPDETPLTIPDITGREQRANQDYTNALTGERIGRLALSPDFVRAMSNDLGRVNTFVLQKTDAMTSAYRNEMKAAQEELLAGRYFAAEERFKRAITAQPTDPMARIGRVHAQLGAGLYISAGLNLVQVLESHPELVGVRYEPTLLPSRERWDSMKTELLKAMETSGSLATETSMLYTYLAYQFEDKDAVIDGANSMVRFKPEDKVYRLAATVWVSSFDLPETPDKE